MESYQTMSVDISNEVLESFKVIVPKRQRVMLGTIDPEGECDATECHTCNVRECKNHPINTL